MADTQSSGNGFHEVYLANQLSDAAINALRRWIRRSPRNPDECFLAVHERKDLPQCCIAWLCTNGFTVVPVESDNVRGRDALMRWRSNLRKFLELPAPCSELCIFIRGLNRLTVAEQQDLWSSWMNTLSPTSTVRFAYSFLPFTEEFDHITKYDVWYKLCDRTIAVV